MEVGICTASGWVLDHVTFNLWCSRLHRHPLTGLVNEDKLIGKQQDLGVLFPRVIASGGFEELQTHRDFLIRCMPPEEQSMQPMDPLRWLFQAADVIPVCQHLSLFLHERTVEQKQCLLGYRGLIPLWTVRRRLKGRFVRDAGGPFMVGSNRPATASKASLNDSKSSRSRFLLARSRLSGSTARAWGLPSLFC
jgi:hypothetical protein